MKLDGKVAIVTGGAQGIGLGIVNCLAEKGADIAIIDINGDKARKVAADVKSSGRKSMAVEADITDNEKVVAAVKEIRDEFGRIDILINNAGGLPAQGINPGIGIIDRTEEEWDKTMDLNLKTQVLMCGAVVPHLIEQKSGKIVNIASIGGRMPSAMLICYATAKAGLIYYTKTLARDLAPNNINVNCICPGVLYTPLWEKGSEEFVNVLNLKDKSPRDFFLENVVKEVPLGREQTPEDIGHAAAFFVSEEARNITGQTLNVDGGMAFV